MPVPPDKGNLGKIRSVRSLLRGRSRKLFVWFLSLTELSRGVPAIGQRQPRLLFIVVFAIFCPLLAFDGAGFEYIELIHAAILPRKS
jgi:hypothetical protein